MSEGDGEVTPVTPSIKNTANREMASVVANLLVEAHTHTSVLKELYKTLCLMAGVAPRSWGVDLLEEYRRHQEKIALDIVSLSATVG